MSDNSSLDSLLEGNADNAPVAVPEAKETPPVQPLDKPDRVEEPGVIEPDAVPPTASDPKADTSPHVPRKALEDERRKRQDLEKKVAELESQFSAQSRPQAQPQQQPQRQIPERPDSWTDPEGAAAWDRAMMEGQIFETRVAMSREVMLQKPDFEEAEAVFVQAAQRDPYLVDQLRRHPFPAKYAYEQGRRIKMMNEIGDDPEAYRERVRDELRAEMGGQQPVPNPNPAPSAPAPKSLAGAPSIPARDARGRFAGPASLEDILGG